MNKKQNNIKDLKGFNIYQDSKYGTIFYDIYTKKGFHLTKSDIKNYSLYISALPFSFIIPIIISMIINIPIWLILLLMVLTFILIETIFRITFLYKLPFENNYVKEKRKILDSILKQFSRRRAFLVLIISIALIICLIIYIRTNDLIEIYLIGTYALLISIILLFLLMIYVVIKKK